MDERHGVPYGVEGERAPSVVQEDPDAGGVGGSHFELILVVTSWVAGIGAEQAPRLAVVADAAAVAVSIPLDAFVGDSYGSPLPTPVYLPVVGAAREGLLTQDLGQGVKPGRVVAVGLGVSLEGSFPVPSW